MQYAPQISVVLPFRNAAATLPACLDSIQRQSWSCFELLAIDDGSDDDSPAIVEARADRDPRVRVLQPGKIGLVGALNLGIAHAKGPVIARMDADDLMHPDRLEAQYTFLQQHPDVALVASQVALFPPREIRAGYHAYVHWQNRCITPDDIAANIYVEAPFAHPSVMMRRHVLKTLGGYRDGPFPEDYELWLRMHHAGVRMAKVPRILLWWRERQDRTSRIDPRYARDAFDRLRARFLAQDVRVRTADRLVIWGAGRITRQRVRHLLDHGIRPCAWIDIDPRKIGQTIWGLPVHPPAWLQSKPRPFVLIYVTRHGAREQVAALLEQWGYRNGKEFLAVG